MKETVMRIVIGALGTLPKWLVEGVEDLEIRGQVETIQTTTLLRSARILRRVLEEYTCYHSNSSEKPSANAVIKKTLKGVIITVNIINCKIFIYFSLFVFISFVLLWVSWKGGISKKWTRKVYGDDPGDKKKRPKCCYSLVLTFISVLII